jgi:hypothetical protein
VGEAQTVITDARKDELSDLVRRMRALAVDDRKFAQGEGHAETLEEGASAIIELLDALAGFADFDREWYNR